ncbi:Tectonin beta-propeller repeat-containing protein [Trichinella pseudospiralis]
METIKALGLNFIFGTLQHPRRHLVAGGSCSIRSMKIVQGCKSQRCNNQQAAACSSKHPPLQNLLLLLLSRKVVDQNSCMAMTMKASNVLSFTDRKRNLTTANSWPTSFYLCQSAFFLLSAQGWLSSLLVAL